MARWLWQLMIAIDQLLNVLLRPGSHDAWADETFSSACWRNRHRQPFSSMLRIVDALFFWQQSHCQEAFNSERLRIHTPPELRQ